MDSFGISLFSVIDDAARQMRRPAFEIFVEEWATMGVARRPDVAELGAICLEAGNVRAASYIYEKVLHRAPLSPAADGPALAAVLRDEGRELRASNQAGDHAAVEERVERAMEEGSDGDLLSGEDNTEIFEMPVPHENAFAVPNVPYRY